MIDTNIPATTMNEIGVHSAVPFPEATGTISITQRQATASFYTSSKSFGTADNLEILVFIEADEMMFDSLVSLLSSH